jgi:protein tyrosine phosphatase (PTP) superfamily phosphohydrolase (DUF442 family)
MALVVSVAAYGVHLYAHRNLQEIVPGRVYRSGQPTRAMLADLQQSAGLKTVINLRGVWQDDAWYQAEKQAARELGLEHHDIDLRSYRLASLAQVRKLLEILDGCPKPVLMHCRQGADRASLASAIYVLAYEGQSLDEAMAQYSPWYGHLGFADGWRLPHLFDCYRDWLREQHASHSPAAFRRWVGSESVVGYFGAAITPAANLQQAVAGRDSLEFDVRNISRTAWRLDPDDASAIRLRVRITDSTGKQTFVSAPGPATVVEPGQSVRITLPVPAELAGQGPFVIFADLQDRHGIHFCDMGVGGCACLLEILPETASGRHEPLTTAGASDGRRLR